MIVAAETKANLLLVCSACPAPMLDANPACAAPEDIKENHTKDPVTGEDLIQG